MGGFSLLLNLALTARKFRLGKINYLLGSLIALVAVTAEEVSQIFVTGRTFDRIDLIFDFSGIFVFGELAGFICRGKT
jgi:VanZ family protein